MANDNIFTVGKAIDLLTDSNHRIYLTDICQRTHVDTSTTPFAAYLETITSNPVDWFNTFPSQCKKISSLSKPKTALLNLLKNDTVLTTIGDALGAKHTSTIEKAWKKNKEALVKTRSVGVLLSTNQEPDTNSIDDGDRDDGYDDDGGDDDDDGGDIDANIVPVSTTNTNRSNQELERLIQMRDKIIFEEKKDKNKYLQKCKEFELICKEHEKKYKEMKDLMFLMLEGINEKDTINYKIILRFIELL